MNQLMGGRTYPGRIYDFPEKRQGVFDQKNDTWGRVIPLSAISDEVGLRYLRGPDFDAAENAERESLDA